MSGTGPLWGAGSDDFPLGPDSQPQAGVPAGSTFQFTFDESKIYPGTTRTVTVYVPAQYAPDRPACLYVVLDGFAVSPPVVFDNLIHKQEIPVLIGVGISPGEVPSARAPSNPRFNRTFEWDSMNGDLARFLVDEILPAVESRTTPDGRPIHLSKNPNDRCVAGVSSGAIAAFTLAWERPDLFRRVFSAIGTYICMRGGDRYPTLVRKTEPKPIRIFMQDGSEDQWMGGPEMGDWWMSNQTMQRALEFAGYQVEHVWGTGLHSMNHPTAVFPDAMRWLWKNWPVPVVAGESQNLFLKAILKRGESWSIAARRHPDVFTLTSDSVGNVYFKDRSGPTVWRIDGDGLAEPTAAFNAQGDAMAFGPEGQLFLMDATTGTIATRNAAGEFTAMAQDIHGRHLVVTQNGNIYATEPDKLWLVKQDGSKEILDADLNSATGTVLSPDGLWLAVAEETTHWGYVYRVEADGTVQHKQRYYWFHVPDWAENSGARAWCADRDGRLYAATRMGVQVFDRNGRVRAILPVPGGPVSGVCFGGAEFDILYVTCGDTVYQRRVKTQGAPAWLAPIKLPSWGAG